MQLEAAHAVEITKLVEYVDRKEDPLILIIIIIIILSGKIMTGCWQGRNREG